MATNDTKISIKEYDTLALVCTYQDADGLPISLDNITVTADIKSTSGNLYENLNVKKQPALGTFVLSRGDDHIPFGQYQIDVLFSTEYANHRVASDTFLLNVDHAITLPKE